MSQIDEATLKNQIKERKFSNAYLIYGNEPYLKQHYANLIAKKCFFDILRTKSKAFLEKTRKVKLFQCSI